MSAEINDILLRKVERDTLPLAKAEFISEETKQKLRDQWQGAGRGLAKVVVKLDESDGTSLYVTGWDGKGNFAGFETGLGFGYIPQERLEAAKIDTAWDAETPLEVVRQNLEEMEKHEVDNLVQALRKAVTKRAKPRRKSEIKNFIKKFEKMMLKDVEKEPVAEAVDPEMPPTSVVPKAKRKAFMKTMGSQQVKMRLESFANLTKKFKALAEGERNEVAAELGLSSQLNNAKQAALPGKKGFQAVRKRMK